ncbi:MAG: hypothetical protein LUE89_11275 [Clostridiales bacterium]|nr:hypothetical protein [Clostridiales bacterium]
MTPEQTALVTELFTRFGHPVGETDVKISCHLRDPAELHETCRITIFDDFAARTIEEMTTALQRLTAYRVALAERYAELETAPKIPVVKLSRELRGYGSERKVVYYLEVCQRNLDSGKDVVVETTRYPGKERHKAIAAFNDYVKAHPGITAEMDIEKKPWER